MGTHKRMEYVIVGSGPSGVHAALTLLERGKQVVLYDVGEEEVAPPLPYANFAELKDQLPDPVRFFLGSDFEALIPPGAASLLVYPPNRRFALRAENPYVRINRAVFDPLLSHARGGLGIAWGANSLAFDDDDLRHFPIRYGDLQPHFRTLGRRMHVCGAADDPLSPYLPTEHPLDPPLRFNQHAARLWRRYECRQAVLRDRFGWIMGHARMAVNTAPDDPARCRYCNRCLWGCGVHAIYDPRATLAACRRYPGFRYRPHALVSHAIAQGGRVAALAIFDTVAKTWHEVPTDCVLLAAGAIASGAILLRTLARDPARPAGPGETLATVSLMDTRVLKVPYLFLPMLGRRNADADFQFNTLIARVQNNAFGEYPAYIHAEVLALAALLYHPMVESLPFGSRYGLRAFSLLRSALGAVTFFLPDAPYRANGIRLVPDARTVTGDRLEATYDHAPAKRRLADRLIATAARVMRRLGCFVVRGRAFYLPDGGGTHFAGTIPMSTQPDPRCVDAMGRSYAYPNCYAVDGATFPSLPSRSLTLNLMANAIRIADAL
ncbi:MAG: GMC family oxidoreductase [Deltaproteobacteria bacterium]|nr:GMC family oxidoreductase [Deltaproteobacteria bacterium]